MKNTKNASGGDIGFISEYFTRFFSASAIFTYEC